MGCLGSVMVAGDTNHTTRWAAVGTLIKRNFVILWYFFDRRYLNP